MSCYLVRLPKLFPNESFLKFQYYLKDAQSSSSLENSIYIVMERMICDKMDYIKRSTANYQQSVKEDRDFLITLFDKIPEVPKEEILTLFSYCEHLDNRIEVVANILFKKYWIDSERKRTQLNNNETIFNQEFVIDNARSMYQDFIPIESCQAGPSKLIETTNTIPAVILDTKPASSNGNQTLVESQIKPIDPTIEMDQLSVINNARNMHQDLMSIEPCQAGPSKPTNSISPTAILDAEAGPSNASQDDDVVLIENPPESVDLTVEQVNEEITIGAEEVIPPKKPRVEPPYIANTDDKLVYKIMEMFPDASTDYIRNICAGQPNDDISYNNIIDIILEEGYPKRPPREPTPEITLDGTDQLQMLESLLPDADPIFLQQKLDECNRSQEKLATFVNVCMEMRNYPTKKEMLRKRQLSAQQKQYTTEFNVERFLEIFPDPIKTFEDPNRKCNIRTYEDIHYVRYCLKNIYKKLYAKDVDKVFDDNMNKNIFLMIKALDELESMGCKKKICSSYGYQRVTEIQNIPLLQELAYFKNKAQIIMHLSTKEREKNVARNNAKELGLLCECSCCYDNEVMPENILPCPGGCQFCRDCIKRSVEIAFSEGKIQFACMALDCKEEFTLQILQNVLSPKLFSKLAQKKMVAEVKAAGVDDLESCPFCDFAIIPPPGEKLFRCLNPDCMKESCRECKEPSHIPLRCDEVEKEEGVKARTYIENQMTEALVRECYKCGAKFIKEDGCNKMTCTCGAIMCYVCRKPVTDYKHFNGQGGTRHDLCPLYSTNYVMHEANVIKAAFQAKSQIDPNVLKNDPTKDLHQHFKRQDNGTKKVRPGQQNRMPPFNRYGYPYQ